MNTEFQRKITPYIDGTLNPEERAEFEAFVATHPEVESQVKKKEDELALLKSMIPVVEFSRSTKESLDGEMKQSVFNLLKQEPKNLVDRIKSSFEEWINR